MLSLLALLPAFFVLTPPAHATFSGQNGKIAFVSNGRIYTMNPNGSGLTNLTQGAWPDWSADGTRIAFARNDGSDSEIFVMNADGSNQVQVTNNQVICVDGPDPCWEYYPADDYSPSWSPDGTRIAFSTSRDHLAFPVYDPDSDGTLETYVMDATGLNQRRISDVDGCSADFDPNWSPNGQRIAYRSVASQQSCGQPATLELVSPEPGGPRETACSAGSSPFKWTPGSQTILYSRYVGNSNDIYELGLPCGGETRLTNTPTTSEYSPSPSPDNTRIVFGSYDGDDEISVMNRDGSGRMQLTNDSRSQTDPDWQSSATAAPSSPRREGYARPKSATGTTVRLVPAFRSCTAGNGAHGEPLVQPSCNPPEPTSHYLTVGTEDSNGYPSQSEGSLQMKVICNPPAPNPTPPCTDPGDQADVKLDARLTDVRCLDTSGGCGTAGTDYTGELEARVTLRITDRLNGDVGGEAATAADVPFSFAVPCSGDEDPTVGGTCTVSTTADALIGGVVYENARAVWQLGEVQIFDGGDLGVARSSGNGLFAVQGLFVP